MTTTIPEALLDAGILTKLLPAGLGPLPWSGAAAPAGWLLCDGSAVSRTTYADLFAAVGTVHGAGDGATTFNLPKPAGRAIIGAGTGTISESGGDAQVDLATNTLAVTANFGRKWFNGMPVVFTLASGTITGLVSGTTYYVVVAGTSTLGLASSLANAQNGVTIDFTAKAAPVWSIAHSFDALAVGATGGEMDHAMTAPELLAHTHSGVADALGAANGVDALGDSSAGTTGSTGGNKAMNNMPPFLALNFIIKY